MLSNINKEKFEKMKVDIKKSEFEDAVIAVTYRCNSRCRMCDIWKKNPDIKNELQPSDYYKLPQTLKNVNISGGEPFLKENLEEIIEVINKTCNFPKIIISTNGLLPEIITEKTKKILKLQKSNNIGIAVSIDGIGENHNRIRGIDNAFDKAIETLVSLKKLKVKNLKIAFTAGDYNVNQLKKVYQLSRKLNVEFSLATVHSSEFFFGKKEVPNIRKLKNELYWLMENEIKSYSLKRWLRAYFTYGMIYFLSTKKRILPDYSGIKSFYLDPYGNIFPSVVSSYKMGNIKEIRDFSEIRKIRVQDNPSNWMICTARASMKLHWMKVGMWILKNRLRVL